MRNLFIILGLSLLFCYPVYGAEAGELFETALEATFGSEPMQLSGSGIITEGDVQKLYRITAQIRGMEETRLRISLDRETINLILTNGTIYDDQMAEQKVSSLFAKMVALGILDSFFMLEILTGERTEIYSPYFTQGLDNMLQLNLSPAESIILYEHWTSDFRGLLGAAADNMSDRELSLAEGFMRQILSALEANIRYTFYIQPDTHIITQIDIQSEISAPEARQTQASIHVHES